MSNNTEYDDKSPESIEKYAKQIEGKTMKEVAKLEGIDINKKNKGRLGHLVETKYFGYKLNSNPEADFEKAGVELKVCPLRKINKKPNSDLISKQQGLSAKERIVLGMINYMEVHQESWENNSLFDKVDLLLLMFYIHEKGQPAINRVFKLASLWEPSQEDLKIIKQDWEKIVGKVRNGKAHQLSEGDTLYLGACTKGSSSKSVREQPFADVPAKQRAFSFKRSYVDSIFEELLTEKQEKISLMENKEKSLSEVLEMIFKPFIGKTAYEIAQELNLDFDKIPKQYYSLLANKIMGSDDETNIEEFRKAGIKMKSIRLSSKGIPLEHMSFPAFKYTKLVKEDWENSKFRTRLEQSKFFFVIYRINTETITEFRNLSRGEQSQNIVLEKVMIWNMPMNDIENEAKEVWQRTVEVINNGGPKIVERVGNRRYNNLPTAKENKVAHVRPHARDKNDTYPLPNGGEFTKHSFWLNKEYLAEQIRTNR